MILPPPSHQISYNMKIKCHSDHEPDILPLQSMDNAVCLFLHFHLRAIRAPNSLGAQKDFSWI